ncbi:porin [Polaromonas jejuensis]|uniref:Porin n=1 Tax=Polaromonas jejuensis TaxID=457502 RepID=A0ABW0Q6G7_9BURK|nr:porin [Polaromonas jejuensis]
MKKYLITLAVVAASGAATAQSSVTLYGIADISLGLVNDGAVRQAKIDSGTLNTSRFGFKGTEDLGGGLKANFLLEQGFSLDNGASLNDSQDGQTKLSQMFSRNAYVGLSGGFGEVRLGKVWSAFDEMNGSANAAWDSALSPSSGVFYAGAIGGYTSNPRNSVIYFTPDMSGIRGAFSYSLGENKTATVAAGSVAAVNVKYASGPLFVVLGHQTERVDGSVGMKKFTRLNANYDFGVAKLLVGVGRQSQADKATNDWTFGATVPVSNNVAISGGFAASTDNVAAGDIKRKGFGVATQYALSKRTALYAGYRTARITSPVQARLTTSLYAMGVTHSF